MMYHNFVKIHSKLRVTPAMATGVTDRLREVWVVALAKAEEAKADRKRGPYPVFADWSIFLGLKYYESMT